MMAAGIDSLGATEMQEKLSERFSLVLPTTLLFDYPSIKGIASFLVERSTGWGGALATETAHSAKEETIINVKGHRPSPEMWSNRILSKW